MENRCFLLLSKQCRNQEIYLSRMLMVYQTTQNLKDFWTVPRCLMINCWLLMNLMNHLYIHWVTVKKWWLTSCIFFYIISKYKSLNMKEIQPKDPKLTKIQGL